jgi:cytochrome c biogenesis factor
VFDIFSNGKFKSYFFTEKRFFKAHKSLTIKVGRFRLGASELYVVPGLPIGETETRSFRIQYRAYVYVFEGGGIIISFGILLSSIIALRRKNL